MTLSLYNTKTRSVDPLVPLREGQVSMYLCGPTVQSPPHLGHGRSAVVFDVLRRWLQEQGLAVTFCRNVTDIDDKIIAKGLETGAPWWNVAYKNRLAFDDALRSLKVDPPDVEPLATGHITEMIEMIRSLIDSDNAYVVESGSIYFRVANLASYGELSGRRLEDALVDGDDGPGSEKESPHDFALWKAAKPGEPSWFCYLTNGRGRPGWHIECSAMAFKYLGEEFDIHGGGMDLTFPHHENELAQSKQCGYGFARHWVHNGLISISGEKMSKSVGNSVTIQDAIDASSATAVRYYLLSAHYRSELTFNDDSLRSALTAWSRLERQIRAADAGESSADHRQSTHWAEFSSALNTDLNTARAISVLHQAAGDPDAAEVDRSAVWRMSDILGLAAESPASSTLPASRLVEQLSTRRQVARSAGDYALADLLRDLMTDAGLAIHDGPMDA